MKILNHTYQYFLNAFTTSHQNTNWLNIFQDPTSFNKVDLTLLDKPLLPFEVTNVVFSFKPFKAPGPDEIHLFFYQKIWKIVGPSVINYCPQVFHTNTLPMGINNTYICLIPKIHNANNLKFFRPIGLCNTIYKVITKIIANRLI